MVDHRDMIRIADKAQSEGGLRTSFMRTELKFPELKCERPVTITKFARPEAPHGSKDVTVIGGKTKTPLEVEIECACRKCAPCLQSRARHWALRAQNELIGAHRTWFATLTLNADQQYRHRLLARKRLLKGGTNFDTLSSNEKFLACHLEIGREITRYLKRVRKGRRELKEEPRSFRYLLCLEAHQTGLPHYHALIHEKDAFGLTWRRLHREWTLGFSMFRLVDENASSAAWYVCKYLSKDALARVRASAAYGQHEYGLEPLVSLTKAHGETTDPQTQHQDPSGKDRPEGEVECEISGLNK